MVELLGAADAEDRQRRAAGALAARGCRWGDRVVFALGSSADLICAVLGAARTGLIPVLLNATLTPAERDLLADDAEPALRIFDPADLAALSGGAPVDLAPYPLTRPMHYTSGTTGRPKGVTTGIWDEATARQVFEDEASVWHFDPADLHMVCSPMYHSVSIRFAAGTLLSGGSLAILSRFERPPRSTSSTATPDHHLPRATHLQRILQSPELGPGETFDSLRLLVHAGAPCPESVKRARWTRVRAGAVWEFYGSTGGAVHGVLARRMARAAGHRGPGPRRPPPVRRRPVPAAGSYGATCRTSPGSATGATTRPRSRPGAGPPAPSATSAGSIRTASCT